MDASVVSGRDGIEAGLATTRIMPASPDRRFSIETTSGEVAAALQSVGIRSPLATALVPLKEGPDSGSGFLWLARCEPDPALRGRGRVVPG